MFPSLRHHTFSLKGVARLSFTARIGRAISLLFTRIQRDGWCGLHCAHRATTASSWGLCEHRNHASCLATPLPSSFVFEFQMQCISPRSMASFAHRGTPIEGLLTEHFYRRSMVPDVPVTVAAVFSARFYPSSCAPDLAAVLFTPTPDSVSSCITARMRIL